MTIKYIVYKKHFKRSFKVAFLFNRYSLQEISWINVKPLGYLTCVPAGACYNRRVDSYNALFTATMTRCGFWTWQRMEQRSFQVTHWFYKTISQHLDDTFERSLFIILKTPNFSWFVLIWFNLKRNWLEIVIFELLTWNKYFLKKLKILHFFS